jgi:DNA-binding CsgD family transcriptional regulator
MNHENLILQAQTIWTEICKNHPDISSIKKLYDEESLEALSKNTNTVIAIVNLRTYNRIFLSKNVVDNFEVESETNPLLGILQYVKFMTLDHAFFPITAGKYYVKFLNSTSYEEKINQRIVFVGPKIKNRFGRISRLFVQTANLDEDEKRNPINLMNSIQDIAHLMKDDFWWMRFSYGDSPQKIKYYHSDIGKATDGDILSDREKDILRLIYEGVDSPEIADRLNITTATVHTHRRNMLNRTGMKDTTALVQIAFSMGMI